MHGLRIEYQTPTRWIILKEIKGLTLDRQYRISLAWRKAIATLNKKYIGQTGFYLTQFYGQ